MILTAWHTHAFTHTHWDCASAKTTTYSTFSSVYLISSQPRLNPSMHTHTHTHTHTHKPPTQPPTHTHTHTHASQHESHCQWSLIHLTLEDFAFSLTNTHTHTHTHWFKTFFLQMRLWQSSHKLSVAKYGFENFIWFIWSHFLLWEPQEQWLYYW